MRKITKWIIILLFLILLIPVGAAAEDTDVRLALIGFENMEENGEHDYLAGLISAVLREDLSNTEGIALLDRRSISNILEEQRLQISGLFAETEAVEAGKLLGSDYLAGGSFVVIGTEVLLDVTIIDVETTKVLSFSSRGGTEDMIHSAAEKITRKLTGERVLYRTADSAIPIIKQELLPPGMLKLFSPLIDARIYLDDEFYGYTVGSSTVPIEIELQPGLHSIETDLGRDFGVVIEPEILFEHWRKEFRIISGKTVVLEDPTRHYNDRLYRLQRVVRDSQTFYSPDAEELHNEWSYGFLDRKGDPVTGSLTLHIIPTDDGNITAEIQLVYNYERKVYTLECVKGEDAELKETIGLINLEIDLESNYSNRSAASWSLIRNDVYQGMHRE
jgi:TolB-like protein